MAADSFHEKPLRVWQSKDLFHKSIKRSFAQIFCLRCDALNRRAAGDKPVLNFVLLLRKLTLDLFFLCLQLLNFFFVHDFNLLTDRWIEKDRLRFR